MAHPKLGNFKTAIDCYQRRLKFAIELGERIGEAAANSNLGSASSTLGDFKTAINYHKRHLEISQELGDRSGESAAYGNLGNAYLHLGAFETAIDYHDRPRKISKQLCDTLGEAIACSRLESCYVVLGQGPAAIGYYQLSITLFNDIRNRLKLSDEWKISLRDQYKTNRNLKIAKEMCDRWGEKRAFQNLGMIAGQNLGDLKTAVNFNERFQKIAKELGDGLGEGEACRQLGIAHHS